MSVKDASSGTVKTYYYEKNLQGDIVGIMNEAGYKVVSYTYDAWGNPYNPTYVYHSGVSVADRANVELNPFRYRGYYYDSETGYYYLQTRYYNPEWGRFINADGYVNANGDILGYNMFAYCGNNPVNRIDPTGKFWGVAIIAAVAITVAIVLSSCSQRTDNSSSSQTSDYNSSSSSNAKSEQYYYSTMAICTDGTGGSHNDKYHQDSTAYMGGVLNADEHYYVVIPVNHPHYRELLGCVAVVRDNSTGKYVYALVGEGGPAGKNGEVSISVAWALGYASDGSYGPEGSFTTIIFYNTKQAWDANILNEQLAYYGNQYYDGSVG